MKRILFVILPLIIGACTSVDQSLWKPLPETIVVKKPFVAKGDVFGSRMVTVPEGTYTLWKSYEGGYLYTCEGSAFELNERFAGIRKHQLCNGGLVLSNRVNKVFLVWILTKNEEIGNGGGEVAKIFVRAEIEKRGYSLAALGPGLTEQQCIEIGLRTGR